MATAYTFLRINSSAYKYRSTPYLQPRVPFHRHFKHHDERCIFFNERTLQQLQPMDTALFLANGIPVWTRTMKQLRHIGWPKRQRMVTVSGFLTSAFSPRIYCNRTVKDYTVSFSLYLNSCNISPFLVYLIFTIYTPSSLKEIWVRASVMRLEYVISFFTSLIKTDSARGFLLQSDLIFCNALYDFTTVVFHFSHFHCRFFLWPFSTSSKITCKSLFDSCSTLVR